MAREHGELVASHQQAANDAQRPDLEQPFGLRQAARGKGLVEEDAAGGPGRIDDPLIGDGICENARRGLEIRGMDRRAANDRVRGLFPAFGLQGHEDSFPDQLSGGMRQRAAFLRTIVQEARVLLLDEPFSALYAVTRLRMQDWLIDRLAERPRAVLMVTHDLYEATQMADRVLVMAGGPGRIVAEIPITTPRADRTEATLAEIRSALKSMLLEETP
jgi:ABC-type nitrate/sulfonate/bicarbonate transport system ATPase subunit